MRGKCPLITFAITPSWWLKLAIVLSSLSCGYDNTPLVIAPAFCRELRELFLLGNRLQGGEKQLLQPGSGRSAGILTFLFDFLEKIVTDFDVSR
jgi:hypothetical protein